MRRSCSGVILAGGLNTRFSGIEKAFISVGGKRILDSLYRIHNDVFEDVIIVTNDPLKYLEWDALIVSDLLPIRSSLTGIHTGLYFTRTPFAFVSACDAPFLKKEVVETIVDACSDNIDVVIPKTAAGLEPLCAVYSTRCLEAIERHLWKNQLKIQLFFRKMRVRHIAEGKLRHVDPHLDSFFNINTPSDLIQAESIGSQSSEPKSPEGI